MLTRSLRVESMPPLISFMQYGFYNEAVSKLHAVEVDFPCNALRRGGGSLNQPQLLESLPCEAEG